MPLSALLLAVVSSCVAAPAHAGPVQEGGKGQCSYTLCPLGVRDDFRVFITVKVGETAEGQRRLFIRTAFSTQNYFGRRAAALSADILMCLWHQRLKMISGNRLSPHYLVSGKGDVQEWDGRSGRHPEGRRRTIWRERGERGAPLTAPIFSAGRRGFLRSARSHQRAWQNKEKESFLMTKQRLQSTLGYNWLGSFYFQILLQRFLRKNWINLMKKRTGFPGFCFIVCFIWSVHHFDVSYRRFLESMAMEVSGNSKLFSEYISESIFFSKKYDFFKKFFLILFHLYLLKERVLTVLKVFNTFRAL